MTKAATVRVPDGMLKKWRERARVDVVVAAERTAHSQAEVSDWEGGSSDPPLSALRTLAVVYDIPLSAFLLAKLKPETAPPVDNRTFAGITTPETNATLAQALNRAIGLQALADELHNALDVEPFMPTAAEDVDPEWLAVQERAKLGIRVADQLNWDDEHEALRRWRLAIERLGIYVLQASLRDTDVRAFSVRGDPPVIVLDRSDWVRARVFSLAHELGHVVIGGSGICSPLRPRQTGIEKWCNEFADALLVPKGALATDPDVRRIAKGEPVSEPVLKRVANRFKVSPAVIWYRLMQSQAISQATFNASWDNWAPWRPPAVDGGGGGTAAENAVRDYGVMLPDLLLRASKRGLIGEVDASQYIGMRPEAIPALEREIASRLKG